MDLFEKREIYRLALLLIILAGIIDAGCSKSSDPVTPPVIPPVTAKVYYVAATDGSDSNAGLATSAAFKTIAKAVAVAKPGDVVNVMNGTYNSNSSPVMTLKPEHSGTTDSYITYKAFEGHHPKITASGNVWNAISVNASFIVFDGLELQGNNANITYDAAYKSFSDYMAGNIDWTKIANFNTNGLSIGGPRKDSSGPHHIIVRNCKIHDFPGGGLGAIQADYVTFENNLVYNNAWYMMYGGSGISILNPTNQDGVTGYKNIVRGNICYSNKTLIPWTGITPARLSDGNGIIIDVNKTPYAGGIAEGQGAYVGRTLVVNNVCFNNGGSGIHCYNAAHIDIVNNTAYGNGTVVGYSEIFSNAGTDVNILNNIMYARTGGTCTSNSNNSNVVYNFNLYFNGSAAVTGANDLTGDPKFVNLSINGDVANFALTSSSPAVNSGTKDLAPAKDILGTSRPKGAGIDRGAYESY
jgi:hypothetical protein